MSYEPTRPFGESPRVHWAREMQDATYRARRVLMTPDTLTHQTTQGIFHRLKPEEQTAEIGAETPITSFSFAARFHFPHGINATDTVVTDATRGPEIDLMLHGCTLATPAEAILASSVNGLIYPYVWEKGTIVLPHPVPEGWVLDIGMCVLSGTPETFFATPEERREHIGGEYGYDLNGAWFTLCQSDDVAQDRSPQTYDTPPRSWVVKNHPGSTSSYDGLYPSNYFRMVRYVPMTGHSPGKTFLSLALDNGNLPQWSTHPHLFTQSFPAGMAVFVIGHGYDVSSYNNLFGESVGDITNMEDWELT